MLAARRTYGLGRSTLSTSAVAVSRCSRLGALAHATTARCRSTRIGSTRQVPAARQQHFSGGSAPGANSLSSSPGVGLGRQAGCGRRPTQLARKKGKTEWVRYQNMMHQRTGLARRDQLSSMRGGVVGPSVNNDAGSGGVETSADSSAAAAAAAAAEASEPDVATPTAAGSSVTLSPPATMATTSSESTAVIGLGPDDGDLAAPDTVPPIATTRQETSSRISSEDAVITDLDSRREAALNAELERKFGTEPPQLEEISGKTRRRRSRGRGRRGAARAVEGTANELQHEPPSAVSGGGGIAPAAESETGELNEVPVGEAAGPITGMSGDGAKPASGEGTPRSKSADESRRGRRNRRGGDATGDGRGGGSLGRGGRGKQAAAASEGWGGGGEGSEDSYSQQQGSAWKNVHAKKKLRWLLKGLASDYGVQEMLARHHISKHTMSKLLRVFEDLVLDHPDTAFPGEAGQKLQEEMSSLCYHPKFQADAVLMKRPIRTRTTSGRSFTFSSKQPKRGREGPFVKERNDVVEKGLIPRLVELAQESYADEIEATKRMDSIVDLRNPQQGFPLARLRKRRIIYHGGPTNSGKTYQAIERLKKAGADRQPGDGPAGLFCGPLRLLALEVYEQLNSQGVYCSLMTGQEKREVPFATHVSCTIEMASTVNEYEVAVIDEIQMLADEQRGPSWTSAVLGLNCPEIHVCGGMEGAVLVEAMAKETGDDFELREYQRKTELVCAEESLGNNYKNIQPGEK
ncbi:ATP-dependent RNA helicase, mitochondrial, putative [Ectocarpus siliculosus]|uniref:RNA helicase n=1 Tax=Ectocarpus siliculosus TaxID=2880 RepID=D8LD59_ECTSI|nr:ATP-dependent RNA helicase, mitochondrial, putative [Ectocarpus siliculosus]|eukprot:CBN78426.1 ATP-dependent RNA helicase, mitochondrial, putative [Ectocarpus siliculosus]